MLSNIIFIVHFDNKEVKNALKIIRWELVKM
jgi:hypothetical protein